MRDLVPLEEVSCAATRLGDALASRALSLQDVPRWEASCLMVGTLPGGVRANAVGLGSLGTIAREMAGSVSGLQRALRLSLAGKWIVSLRLDTRSHNEQQRRPFPLAALGILAVDHGAGDGRWDHQKAVCECLRGCLRVQR